MSRASPLEIVAEPLHREPYNEAVDRALEFLSREQGTDGAWTTRAKDFNLGGGYRIGKDPAVTSLCVMAFLSAGHVPGEGPYGKVVENGIKFVLAQQKPNGLFAGDYQGQIEMYPHGICTLMLAEAVGTLPDRAAAKRLRKQLELAVEIVLKAQVQRGEDRGGWRYKVDSTDADLSVTGWQLMALRGKERGLRHTWRADRASRGLYQALLRLANRRLQVSARRPSHNSLHWNRSACPGIDG